MAIVSVNRKLNDHLSGKELFVQFTVHALSELVFIYVYTSFLFGFEMRSDCITSWSLFIISQRQSC